MNYIIDILEFSKINDAFFIRFKDFALILVKELMIQGNINQAFRLWLSVFAFNEQLILSSNVSQEAFTEIEVIRVIVNYE